MKQYLDAVREVLKTGERKPNRTGVDTIATSGVFYKIDLSKGFPLLTTKKISWKNIVIEMLWFLSGSKNIDILHKHECRFWDRWTDDNNEVPSAYGDFWRNYPSHWHEKKGEVYLFHPNYNDQIAYIIKTLRNNPDSRRMVLNAWYPDNAQKSSLPPCHCMFILNVQYKNGVPTLCSHLMQRSCDIAIGVPYNIASYALLTHIFSVLSGISVGTFSHLLCDAHIYTSKSNGKQRDSDHIPGLKRQLEREPKTLPSLEISDWIHEIEDIESLAENTSTEAIMEVFRLKDYDPHPFIKFAIIG